MNISSLKQLSNLGLACGFPDKHKICIVALDLFSKYGGLEKTAITVANYLSFGYDVTIAYRKSKIITQIKNQIKDSVHLLELDISENIMKLLAIRQKLIDLNIGTVICMFSWNEAEYGPVILQNTEIKFIYSEHNCRELVLQRGSEENRNFILQNADAIRFQGETENQFQAKSVIIPNGIELAHYSLPFKEKTILYVGRIEEKIKNTKELLDVFSNLDTDWTLVLYRKGIFGYF